MELLDGILNVLLITLLGLLIAFSPMIVIVNVLVVLKSSRPILRTAVLMAGMALPLLILATLAILFLDPNSQLSLKGLTSKVSVPPIIDLLLGVWLLVLAWRRWQYTKTHRVPKKTSNLIMKNPPDKLPALFVFAFVKSILSVTNLFAVLAVSKLILTNSVKQPLATLAVLWVILIGLLPFGVILYFYFFKHEKLEQLSAQVDKLLSRNLDFAITLALACSGVFFILHALADDLIG